MRVRKIVLAAAAAAAAVTATPATADPTFQTGFNTGDLGFISLTTNVVGAASDSPDSGVLDAKCEFHQVTRPSSNQVVLIVEGHGAVTPSGSERAISTDVRCQLRNAFTGSIVFDDTIGNEGPVNVWVPQAQFDIATSFVVCAEANAHFSDGAFVTTDYMRCQFPF